MQSKMNDEIKSFQVAFYSAADTSMLLKTKKNIIEKNDDILQSYLCTDWPMAKVYIVIFVLLGHMYDFFMTQQNHLL